MVELVPGADVGCKRIQRCFSLCFAAACADLPAPLEVVIAALGAFALVRLFWPIRGLRNP
jgi:hypothetical protein